MNESPTQPSSDSLDRELGTGRRKFLLRVMGASIGTPPLLAACGGSGASANNGASTIGPTSAPTPAPTPQPTAAPTPAPTPAPSPASPPTGARKFTVTSPTTGTHPLALAFVFKQGEVAGGQYAVCSEPTLQVTPKSTWPDGSLRIAIVAGQASLSGSTPKDITFTTTGTAPGGTPLTTAQLRATGVSASIGCGPFGTVAWSGSDWDSPFSAWVSGPAMSSWIFRKPVGSDAHLVAWLEVRLFAGGQVEILPWVENGYIKVASPSNKGATYTFAIGGSTRFSGAIDLPARCRTPLVSGAALSYWLGADPGIVVRHDATYLMSTRVVPRYGASVPPTSSLVTGLPSSFTPLQLGGFPSTMGTAGYHPSIGLLPEWDVLYLVSSASTVSAALQRNAYSAGRYPIHYRDERTLRPLRFSQYPNLSVNSSSTGDYPATATGTGAPAWNLSHHPSIGFMAYLVTGRYYHLETLQFAATFGYLFQVDTAPFGNRLLSQGVFMSHSGANTVRGAAWSIRTLAQAAIATPDGDVLGTEFLSSLGSNVSYYHGKHVAQTSSPFGHVQPYSDASGTGDNVWYERSWMQDFFVQSVGYAKALRPTIGAANVSKLDGFFEYNAKSIVGRFGGAGPTEYLFRDAAVYDIAMAASDSPDWDRGTGPWATSWGQIYSWTMAFGGSTPTKEIGDGSLRGGNSSSPTGASGYWGNLLPALSYAVEHGAAGAAAAYSRLVGAPNWSGIAGGFAAAPVWSVLPP